MIFWNLFLAGRVDTLVKKVNKEEIKDEPSKPEDSHEPLAPDTPDVDVPDTGDSTGDNLGGAGDDLPKKDIGTGDTLSDVEYPSLGKNYNDGIALASAQYNKNVPETPAMTKSPGMIIFCSLIKFCTCLICSLYLLLIPPTRTVISSLACCLSDCNT